VMWSSSTMAGAKKQFKDMNAPRPQPTDDMTPNTETGGNSTPAPAKKPFQGFKGSAVGGTSANTY